VGNKKVSERISRLSCFAVIMVCIAISVLMAQDANEIVLLSDSIGEKMLFWDNYGVLWVVLEKEASNGCNSRKILILLRNRKSW